MLFKKAVLKQKPRSSEGEANSRIRDSQAMRNLHIQHGHCRLDKGTRVQPLGGWITRITDASGYEGARNRNVP
eukprot:3389898-Amphidinium_carterae.1